MDDKEIEHIYSMNNRLLLVMGFATSVLIDMSRLLKNGEDPRLAWIIQAIDNIVYQNKPLPPMPEL